MREEFEHVPWLPLSVIQPPGVAVASRGVKTPNRRHTDMEANLNALLGTLGPSEGNGPPVPREAVGGTVGSVRMDESGEGGTEEEDESARQFNIQLQRVAPRCHCRVIYVTYGDQVEAEITRSSSPGSMSVS